MLLGFDGLDDIWLGLKAQPSCLKERKYRGRMGMHLPGTTWSSSALALAFLSSAPFASHIFGLTFPLFLAYSSHGLLNSSPLTSCHLRNAMRYRHLRDGGVTLFGGGQFEKCISWLPLMDVKKCQMGWTIPVNAEGSQKPEAEVFEG